MVYIPLQGGSDSLLALGLYSEQQRSAKSSNAQKLNSEPHSSKVNSYILPSNNIEVTDTNLQPEVTILSCAAFYEITTDINLCTIKMDIWCFNNKLPSSG